MSLFSTSPWSCSSLPASLHQALFSLPWSVILPEYFQDRVRYFPRPRRVSFHLQLHPSRRKGVPSLWGGQGPWQASSSARDPPSEKRSKASPTVNGSPRRAAVKTKRQDSLFSSSLRRPKLSQGSDESSSGFDLTPSQSPGPTRPLSELRVDPRIPNDGKPVGIGDTLLPFAGEGLFSLTEIYFPVYDRKGVKTRWRPAELALCSYLGTRVRHSVATRPDYHSAYLLLSYLKNGTFTPRSTHPVTIVLSTTISLQGPSTANFSPLSIRRLVKCRFGWLRYLELESCLGKNCMRSKEKLLA